MSEVEKCDMLKKMIGGRKKRKITQIKKDTYCHDIFKGVFEIFLKKLGLLDF